MSKRESARVITDRVREHPAVVAVKELGFTRVPTSLEVLKEHPKTIVCRLLGAAGGRRGSIIAKNVKRNGPSVERVIYEQVFPRLALDTLEYFGSVDDVDGNTVWMFFEDAGETGFSYAAKHHRALFLEWLGELHTAFIPQGIRDLLPDRGVDHFLRQLAQTSQKINESLDNPAFLAGDVTLLKEVDAGLQMVRSHWETIERFDELVPRSLMHGDLALKNLRVRAQGGRLKLFVMDWETAGWGAPYVDMESFFVNIPGPELRHYVRVLKRCRWMVDYPLLRRMRAHGSLMRHISSIYWESHHLIHDQRERVARRMTIYNEGLRSAFGAIRTADV